MLNSCAIKLKLLIYLLYEIGVVIKTTLYLTILEFFILKSDAQLISINKTRSILLIQLNWDFSWYFYKQMIPVEILCFKNTLGGISNE